MRRKYTDIRETDAADIVTKFSDTYERFNQLGQAIKPKSALSHRWYIIRESFHLAYNVEFDQLPPQIHSAYKQIYPELALFIDDEIYADFEHALNEAVKCRVKRFKGTPINDSEETIRYSISSRSTIVLSRDEIIEKISFEETCPEKYRNILIETLSYCMRLYGTMWDEWAAYSVLIYSRKK
jgi:hypothetical protein